MDLVQSGTLLLVDQVYIPDRVLWHEQDRYLHRHHRVVASFLYGQLVPEQVVQQDCMPWERSWSIVVLSLPGTDQ